MENAKRIWAPENRDQTIANILREVFEMTIILGILYMIPTGHWTEKERKLEKHQVEFRRQHGVSVSDVGNDVISGSGEREFGSG